ncbi:Mitochondrial matrix protein frataxin, involved in Fe/S protein biosynthesis [Trachipleistophora hominis]|uniref:Frataxin n=1 Tax=Trachipleistophora hominis TaxID=72359 RepID=FRDA_TRAHO|nr:RecName: Full=Frataxin; Short=Fxn [Trachipleistophora hominis]ABS58599.1 frataxin [Trachipleistophora hominis]ELQ75646.1 Mitochondrial matrix protein frataxin, involved in Fe/S protein biosynthesis [Trachipleistophora hominis]
MLQKIADQRSYLTAAHNTLTALEKKLDNDYGEIEHNNNVIEYTVDGVGRYVVSRQPSVMELWVSSPITGPSKFGMVEKKFVEKKNGMEIMKYFEMEMERIKRMLGNR